MKLYVLVRRDMSLSQIAVQAGHAVGAFCKAYPDVAMQDWNDTLVYLGVRDEDELTQWSSLLKKNSEWHVEWHEGYWNNSLTSIASLENPTIKRMVKDLHLV